MNESTLYSTVRNHSYRAPIHLLLTGGALFFFQVRRGRKTFCQSTVMSIGKFSLNSETSPGGEHDTAAAPRPRRRLLAVPGAGGKRVSRERIVCGASLLRK
jgi:hypothetical protein